MRCHRCQKDNVNHANYCKFCGTPFPDREKGQRRAAEMVRWNDFIKRATVIIVIVVFIGYVILRLIGVDVG